MRISGWLFLAQQTMCTACLVTALGRGAGLPVRWSWRLWLCALAGGCAVLAAAALDWPLLRLALILPLMALPSLAFPCRLNEGRRRLPAVTVLLLLSALGVSRMLGGMGMPGAAVLLLTCGSVLIVLPALLPRRDGPRHVRLRITLDGVTADMDALVDSGNLVVDPVTHLPVIVLSEAAAAQLAFTPLALRPGMRLMRTRTASGSMLLTLIRPQCIRLGNRPVLAMIGAVPPGPAGFTALVPSRLAETRTCQGANAADFVTE